MTRADVAQLARRDVEVEVDERRAQPLGEVVGHVMQLAHDLGRLEPVDRVGAQRGAQLAHRHGRLDAAPDDVADDDADATARKRDDVVPVAAHLGLAAARQVAHGELDARRPPAAGS